MSDVFLSYSRKDKAFVQQLHAGLARLGRDVWVDWEDIPPTADWLREIKQGIDAANTFVFVISPDSAASDICYQEVDHADKNNKRIIPILYRETAPDTLHPTISSHNWVIFADQDFGTAFNTLIKAMDTDLAYVREHTRLLIRAREWESNERENGFLLAGKDLDNAETWIANATDKSPAPLTLHGQYIQASRTQQQTRQRRIQLGLIAGLVISVGLMILSIIAFQDAATQRDIAQDERATAYAFATEADIARDLAESARATSEAFLPQVTLNISQNIFLNIYSGATNSSTVLAQVNGRQTIRVLAYDGGNWYYVAYGDDLENTGWITTQDFSASLLDNYTPPIARGTVPNVVIESR
ncbi:MAG: TIR domain-containing protein [Chloroflexota bacterium]